MSSFTIRPGTADDIDDVGELHTLVREKTYKSIIKGYRSHSTTPFWRMRFPAEAATNRLLIASGERGETIGFVYVGQGTLFAIHVHPDWHGRGVGRALLRAGRNTLVELGFRRAALWVIAGNERACRFYERDGWRRSGRTRDDDVGGILWSQLEYIRELDVTQMWHNPDCSKCAAATSALDEAGVEVTLRPYLTQAPGRDELTTVLRRLKAEPWDICRVGEPIAAELGLADWPRDESERDRWIDAMVAHPVLIQRPIILLADGSAFVARTPAALADVIDRARRR